MAGFVTNRGKKRELDVMYRGQNVPGGFYVALVTAAAAPTVDTNLWSDLSANEVAAGNGYTAGGQALARGTAGFDVLTEDDSADRAFVQAANIVWTASGGPIPASGSGARYAVLLDDNGTPASREVLLVWDLGADRTVSSGQTLTLQDAERRTNNG
ncbi:MAG: hypothetical protein IT340_23530 [Chloroflexi bacterium]|nr:hypothetical protein [Chloroflexota bacterium]